MLKRDFVEEHGQEEWLKRQLERKRARVELEASKTAKLKAKVEKMPFYKEAVAALEEKEATLKEKTEEFDRLEVECQAYAGFFRAIKHAFLKKGARRRCRPPSTRSSARARSRAREWARRKQVVHAVWHEKVRTV